MRGDPGFSGKARQASAVARFEPAAAAAGDNARARLAALEHLVDALVVLIDAGEFDRAKVSAHACRTTRR